MTTKPEDNPLWQKARSVDCPYCKVAGGEPCRYTMFLEGENNKMQTHHRARYEAARKLMPVEK